MYQGLCYSVQICVENVLDSLYSPLFVLVLLDELQKASHVLLLLYLLWCHPLLAPVRKFSCLLLPIDYPFSIVYAFLLPWGIVVS